LFQLRPSIKTRRFEAVQPQSSDWPCDPTYVAADHELTKRQTSYSSQFT